MVVLYIILSWIGAVVIHECGHCIVAWLLKINIARLGLFGFVIDHQKKIRFEGSGLGSFVVFRNAKPTVLNLGILYAGGAVANVLVVMFLPSKAGLGVETFTLMNGVIAAVTLLLLNNLATDGSMLLNLVMNPEETVLHYTVSYFLTNEYTEKFDALLPQVLSTLDGPLGKVQESHIIIYLSYLNYVCALKKGRLENEQKQLVNKVFNMVLSDKRMKSRYLSDYMVGEVMTQKLISGKNSVGDYKELHKLPILLKRRIAYLLDPEDTGKKADYYREITTTAQGESTLMINGELSYLAL